MTPHETGSTATPADARAAAPLTRTFGPQGPTLGDLSDAYLQDTTRCGSSGPTAPPVAGSPISPRSSAATASPSGAGVRRGAPPARPLGCRPASSTIAGAPPPAT